MDREARISFDHVKYTFNSGGGIIPKVTKQMSNTFDQIKLLHSFKVTGTAKLKNSKKSFVFNITIFFFKLGGKIKIFEEKKLKVNFSSHLYLAHVAIGAELIISVNNIKKVIFPRALFNLDGELKGYVSGGLNNAKACIKGMKSCLMIFEFRG